MAPIKTFNPTSLVWTSIQMPAAKATRPKSEATARYVLLPWPLRAKVCPILPVS
jgi:hypothetical protein